MLTHVICSPMLDTFRKAVSALMIASRIDENGRMRAMLILTRRVGQSLRIGDDISVQVIEVRGEQVRLGVTAPKSVAMHREEVFERIAREDPAKEEAPRARVPAEKRISFKKARRP